MATVAGSNGAPPPPTGGGGRRPTDLEDGGGGKQAALSSKKSGGKKIRRTRMDLVLKDLVIKQNAKDDSITIHDRTQAERGAITIKISAGLHSPGMWEKSTIPDAMASRTKL